MDGIKCLLKFGEYYHIQSFANGNLYCSDAETFWGIEDKLKIKGQGDILEAGTKIFAQKMASTEHRSDNTLLINANANGLIHIEPAKHMPVYCVFAVGENQCTIDKSGELIFHFSDDMKRMIKEHFAL